jgi:hypothetical protein
MTRGVLIGSAVERWDPSARKWENTFKGEEIAFCHPYPLGMVETQIITKRLWPGQSIATREEATAARDVFAIGDKARFVVIAGDSLALPTAAFSIDEHPSMPNIPYRISN